MCIIKHIVIFMKLNLNLINWIMNMVYTIQIKLNYNSLLNYNNFILFYFFLTNYTRSAVMQY